MKTRLIAALLALTILFSLVPITALGVADTPMSFVVEEYGNYINPLCTEKESFWEDIPVLNTSDGAEEPEYLNSQTDVISQIRANYKNRVERFDIYYKTFKAIDGSDLKYMVDAAEDHTGNPTEGDYLRWNIDFVHSKAYEINTDGIMRYYQLSFQATYYASAAQEEMVDAAVVQLRQELALDQLSGYQSLKAIYDWLCANVTFDDLTDESTYPLRHSAYGALVSKYCVCQGYALALYRLLLEEGIDCRIIAGDSDGDGVSDHNWNIAKLDGKYYNLDATWDAGSSSYSYFLVSQDNFTGHNRDPEYDTLFFHADYPMATENYTYTGDNGTEILPTEPRPTEPAPTEPRPTEPKPTEPAPTEPRPGNPEIVDSGTCGENLTWTLDSEGTLTISGIGNMYDYGEEGFAYPQWYPWRDTILSVVVEDGVTSIGADAFAHHDSLSSITLPESLTSIDGFAFYACYSLSSITFPEGVTSIGEYAFLSCDSLTSITLPKSLDSIGDQAFSSCDSLKSITILEGITRIGPSAFSGCINLSNVTLPDSLTSIDGAAFASCDSLSSITLPDSLTSIGNSVFFRCGSLSSITIPESLTSIGDFAFYECDSLSTVHYAGTAAQAADIVIGGDNEVLKNVAWHYECDGASCPNPFGDVAADAYYAEPVRWAVNNGITNGLSADTFGPDATCTRAQIVTFLWRSCGSPKAASATNPFADVPADAWYADAVLWAVEKGITSGTSATTFSPDAGCTRGQVATFLWRSQKQPASGASNIFTDIVPGSYYYNAVLWAVEKGITNGVGEGTFAPDATCTRGQIVTFLYRAMA